MGLFDNYKDLPDEFEVALGDKGTMTLGALRGLESTLNQREQALQSTAAERDAYRTRHDELASGTAKLLSTADRMTEAPNPTVDIKTSVADGLRSLLQQEDPSEALFQDKLFGKALSRVEERALERARQEYAPLQDNLKQLASLVQNGFTQLTQAQVAEREHRWYDVNRSEIPKGEDGKRVPLSAVKQYAQERGVVVPNTNLLDLDRALEMMTEPTRIEARMSEAERRGYERGLSEARTSSSKAIPLFGDRSAGGIPKDRPLTQGKTQKQIISEALQRGLSEAAGEN